MRGTLRGATRPHRGTWLIRGVLAVVDCLSHYADGASRSLVMAAVQAVLTCGIFLLSIRWGRAPSARSTSRCWRTPSTTAW